MTIYWQLIELDKIFIIYNNEYNIFLYYYSNYCLPLATAFSEVNNIKNFHNGIHLA